MSRLFSSSPLMLGIIEDVDISSIKPFFHNYRDEIGDLNDLTQSIIEKGLLHPILVRSKEEGYYEIIAGHRRYQACKMIGWRKIICHIIEVTDQHAFEISLIENIQRKSLDPLEEASAYKKYVLNFGWGGVSDLAAKLGKSISYIDKKIRLLDLPSNVIESLSRSTLCASTAEELLSLKSTKRQSELAALVQKKNLSSRDTREFIKNVKRDKVYDYESSFGTRHDVTIKEIDEKSLRSFDKSIIALKIAMRKLSNIIEETQENWIIYEILMQHKNMLHSQIDLLIKEKMKL